MHREDDREKAFKLLAHIRAVYFFCRYAATQRVSLPSLDFKGMLSCKVLRFHSWSLLSLGKKSNPVLEAMSSSSLCGPNGKGKPNAFISLTLESLSVCFQLSSLEYRRCNCPLNALMELLISVTFFFFFCLFPCISRFKPVLHTSQVH